MQVLKPLKRGRLMLLLAATLTDSECLLQYSQLKHTNFMC